MSLPCWRVQRRPAGGRVGASAGCLGAGLVCADRLGGLKVVGCAGRWEGAWGVWWLQLVVGGAGLTSCRVGFSCGDDGVS